MEYHGSNDDREHADEIRSSYVGGMKRFVRWLVDHDRRVVLLIGDTNGSDERVVHEILADMRESRPDLDPSRVTAQPVISFSDVMEAIQSAGSVVAIRFHNVIGALKLGKPTIAIGYSPKHEALMMDMGVPQYCQPVYPFDFDLLIQRFAELESNSAELRLTLAEHNAANERLLDDSSSSCQLRSSRTPSRSVRLRHTSLPGRVSGEAGTVRYTGRRCPCAARYPESCDG